MPDNDSARVEFEIRTETRATEPAPHPDRIGYDHPCEQRERRTTTCGDREQGHAWTVVGQPYENPRLVCADCRAGAEDAHPGIDDHLYGERFEIGERTILFSEELPDAPDSDFVIPVHLSLQVHSWTSMNSIGPEFETVIELTERLEDQAHSAEDTPDRPVDPPRWGASTNDDRQGGPRR